MPITFSPIAGFLFLAIFWGGSFLGIRYSIEVFPPMSAAALRIIIGGLVTLLFMYARGARLPKNSSHTIQLLLIGFLCLGIPWGLLFWGEQFVSPGMCSILNSTTPLFTVIIASMFIKNEHVSIHKWLGVSVGFVGILIIFGPRIILGEDSQLKGLLALLGMALGYALGISWIRDILKEVSGTAAFFLQCIGALIFLVPGVFLFERDRLFSADWSSVSAWSALFYLGIFSTAFAQVVFLRLIKDLGAVSASAITYIIPIVAIFLDWMFFKILPTVSAAIGGLVILAGVKLIHSSRVIPNAEVGIETKAASIDF